MPLEPVCRRNVEEFEAMATIVLECSQQNLMGHCGGSVEKQNADQNVDSKDGARTPSRA